MDPPYSHFKWIFKREESSMKTPPLEVAKNLIQSKILSAPVLFVGGSFQRQEETPYSDIDIVVLSPHIEFAYRESIVFLGWQIELFFHDPSTIRYFFREMAYKDGIPSLAYMILEGDIVYSNTKTDDDSELMTSPAYFKAASLSHSDSNLIIKKNPHTELANSVIQEAQAFLVNGPDPLSKEELNKMRYLISDLIDDLGSPRTKAEALSTLARLHEILAHFWFRSQNKWSAHGKQINRRMALANPEFSKIWNQKFESAFSGDYNSAIDLAEKILKPYGGYLFEGFKLKAPSNWRTN
jgi:hypothetical protein